MPTFFFLIRKGLSKIKTDGSAVACSVSIKITLELYLKLSTENE